MDCICKKNIINNLKNYQKKTTGNSDLNGLEDKVIWHDYNKINQSKNKYIVYKTDVKNKKHSGIDPKRANWDGDETENEFMNDNMNNASFRLKMCKNEGYEILDLDYIPKEKINNIMSSPFMNKSGHMIKHLFMEDCGLTDVPDLKSLVHLETLNMSNNKLQVIKSIPSTVTELYATDNEIKSVPDSMNNVIRVNLSNNKLKKLGKLNSVEYLDISNNLVISISNNYPKLLDFTCNNNTIKQLGDMPNVKYINIADTHVSILSGFPNLQFVIANNSKLKGFLETPVLNELLMINTEIKHIHHVKSLRNLMFGDGDDFTISDMYDIESSYCKNSVWQITLVTPSVIPK